MELTKEYLEDRFCVQGWGYLQIKEESGASKSNIANSIRDYGLRKKQRYSKDLTGQTFSKLKVIERYYDKGDRCIHWLCECECGGTSTPTTANLTKGLATSCGCMRHQKTDQSKCWKGCGKVNGRYWCIIKSNASKRKINFDLTIEHASQLFIDQKEKCALTGWGICFSKGSLQTASLDRIDSSKGYEEGNVQWVHKKVNLAKNTMSQEFFIDLCNSVTKNMN